MGGFLDAPIRDKNPENDSNDYFGWGACGMQGWRSSMEDTHICQKVDMPQGVGEYGMLFGVFDGHGGAEVAKYAQDHFKNTFQKQ